MDVPLRRQRAPKEECATAGSAQRQIPGAIAWGPGEALQPSLALFGAGGVGTALALATMSTRLRALVDRIGMVPGVLGHERCSPKSANLVRTRVDPRSERREGRERGFTRCRRG